MRCPALGNPTILAAQEKHLAFGERKPVGFAWSLP